MVDFARLTIIDKEARKDAKKYMDILHPASCVTQWEEKDVAEAFRRGFSSGARWEERQAKAKEPYAFVICEGCGKTPLTKEQYDRQMTVANRPWICMNCGGSALFDDKSFEKMHMENSDECNGTVSTADGTDAIQGNDSKETPASSGS